MCSLKFRIPRRFGPVQIAVLSCLWFVPDAAGADYFYAATAGFESLTTNSPANFALLTNTVTITRQTNLSPDMTQSTASLTFSATSPANPDWVAGTRDFYQVALDTTTGSPGTVTYQFAFATALPTSSFLVFADFDVQEQVSIRAYDETDTLIPFANTSFSKQNGQDAGGSSAPTTYTSVGGYTGRISDTGNSGLNNPVVSLNATVPIKRVVYEFNLNPNSVTGLTNSLRFNFAVVPEPSTYVLGAISAIAISWISVRRRSAVRS